jgi:hypothetical protein
VTSNVFCIVSIGFCIGGCHTVRVAEQYHDNQPTVFVTVIKNVYTHGDVGATLVVQAFEVTGCGHHHRTWGVT